MLHLLHIELIGHLTLDLPDTKGKFPMVQFCSSFQSCIMGKENYWCLTDLSVVVWVQEFSSKSSKIKVEKAWWRSVKNFLKIWKFNRKCSKGMCGGGRVSIFLLSLKNYNSKILHENLVSGVALGSLPCCLLHFSTSLLIYFNIWNPCSWLEDLLHQ